MKTYNYNNLSSKEIENLCSRQKSNDPKIMETVKDIFANIAKNGDNAIHEYAKRFDNVQIEKFFVDIEEINQSEKYMSDESKNAIKVAYNNIRKFQINQLQNKVKKIETMPGVSCWQKDVAIQNIALYIPGGTAPLVSTILMLGIPSKIAGCANRILLTPPDRNGRILPEILYAAKICGIKKIAKVGGIQAIAGVTIGTESLPKVDKIFGPGNSFVTQAKSYAQNNFQVSIDMPAGPSEVLVLTDEYSNPKFIASDLLSQAEHGSDSQSVLICESIEFSKKVLKEIDSQIQNLSRKKFILESLENSFIIICPNKVKSIEFINIYAPEHLIIQTENSDLISDKIINAGSIFIGPYSPESVGDYASGTNHVLPTSGFAKSYSGVTIQSFMKTIFYQKLSLDGLKVIAPSVSKLADIEGLDAHKNAVKIRF